MTKSPFVLATLLCVTASALTGCVSSTHYRHSTLYRNAIPASQLPPELLERRRDGLVPIDFSLLQQPQPESHLVGPKDILGVYIEEVLDEEGRLPTVQYPFGVEDRIELFRSPSVGHPIEVSADGTLPLPLIDPVPVNGLTLPQVTERIRESYAERQLINPGVQHISVNLIRVRSTNVVVVREDTATNNPLILRRDTQIVARRGSAAAIDLPAFENDVLHALVATGGLPGVDGESEVWVLRGDAIDDGERQRILGMLQAGERIDELLLAGGNGTRFVRIPLRVCLEEPLPFTRSDVILQDGDIVYVDARQGEEFIGGGLLNGGVYTLPRDRDIDVFEAIAIANSNLNGPAGANAAATNFRSGPGNIVPPTNVFVVRKLPNGEQIKIYVDLKAAMNNPRERLIIQPGDILMLKYKPGELVANIALNFVNVNGNL